MTLGDATVLFLDSFFGQSDRSPKTHKAYECDLRQFSEFVGNGVALASVCSEHCEHWVADLKRRGLKSSTRKRKIATLRCFFSEFVRRNRLAISPWKDLRFRFPTGSDIPKTLQLSDARAIVAEARTAVARNWSGASRSTDSHFLSLRNRAIVQLLFSTGIRVGELTALKTGDVHLGNCTVLIHGKGGRERIAFLTDDKVVEAMQTYLDARTRGISEYDAVFLNYRGGALSEQGVAHILEGLARKAQIKHHITPHMIRHTAATLLLQGGADIRIVQEFLGHSSISTTQRYAHVTRNHLRSTLERVQHTGVLDGGCEKIEGVQEFTGCPESSEPVR